jgi:hypothetical protein
MDLETLLNLTDKVQGLSVVFNPCNVASRCRLARGALFDG